MLEAVPFPDVFDVPPPRYVTDGLVDDVLDVMVALLLPVDDDDTAAGLEPDRRVVDDMPDDSVMVVEIDRYERRPVGKSPIALPPDVAVPVNVIKLCADTAAAAAAAAAADSRAVQRGGAIGL